MTCRTCGEQLKKRLKMFCSVKCRSVFNTTDFKNLEHEEVVDMIRFERELEEIRREKRSAGYLLDAELGDNYRLPEQRIFISIFT